MAFVAQPSRRDATAFPQHTGGAAAAQKVWQDVNVSGQSRRHRGVDHAMLQPRMNLIAPAHELRARRGAYRLHVVVLQLHTLHGKFIQVRRAQQVVVLRVVVANVRVAVVAGGGEVTGASGADGVSVGTM